MRRVETYVGQQVYEYLFSAQAQYTMTAVAKVCAALLGTSGTVNGLACSPTSPATMTVQIGAGELYQMESLEATVCGTLPADTTHTILKQGIQLGTYTTATFAAPTTSGQSINYLIEAQYQDADISLDPTTGNTPVVLQFYNSANPSAPWSGPNNSSATSNNWRDGVVAYQIKAGSAATTGTQVTPSPDTGWIGLWVVTVPFGASSLTSSNISQYAGSPILPSGMLQSIITSNLTYGVDSGTAGVVQAKFPIPVTTLVDGMDVWVKIAATNTGAATFTPNPGVVAAAPVIGAAHTALQGGELAAGGRANFIYRTDATSWVLVECSGGATQVAPATASQHAPQMVQVAGIVGSVRNLAMNITAASSSAVMSADEIIVETALGGVRYCMYSFSGTINLAATGVGGMDTGSAPVSGYVGVYAILNPTTGSWRLLATNATSAAVPNIYSGTLPTGYIASALVSVWPTNASGQFVVGYQADRNIAIAPAIVLSSSTSQSSLTALSIAAAVPKNARSISGTMAVSSTAASPSTSLSLSAIQAAQIGQQAINSSIGAQGSISASYKGLILSTAQVVYYTATATAGTPTYSLSVSEYSI